MLTSQDLQSKLDGKDVDGKDGNSHHLESLGAESFMKEAEGKKQPRRARQGAVEKSVIHFNLLIIDLEYRNKIFTEISQKTDFIFFPFKL